MIKTLTISVGIWVIWSDYWKRSGSSYMYNVYCIVSQWMKHEYIEQGFSVGNCTHKDKNCLFKSSPIFVVQWLDDESHGTVFRLIIGRQHNILGYFCCKVLHTETLKR